MSTERRTARDLINEAIDLAIERGHNVELRRTKESAHIPLFRYKAIGRCTCCGADLVVDTSPAQLSMNVPFGEKGNAWPTISGAAIDGFCTDEKKGHDLSPRAMRKRTRIGKMSPAQYRRHKYFLRIAMSR